ncbi:unnamed protein product, partial [Cladocopium goreaui]
MHHQARPLEVVLWSGARILNASDASDASDVTFQSEPRVFSHTFVIRLDRHCIGSWNSGLELQSCNCLQLAAPIKTPEPGQQSPVNPDRLCGTSMCNLHKRRGEKTGQLEVVDFITVGAKHALELALLRKELEICRSEAAAQIQALREELRSMGLVKLEARNRVEQKKLRNS